MKYKRMLFTLLGLLVIVGLLVACAPAATEAPSAEEAEPMAAEEEAPAAEESGGEKIKVGLSFSDFATERWKPEEEMMRGLLEDMGYEVLTQEANHDVKLQNDQIDNMVAQGAKGLIVIAEDGDAVVTSTDKAVEAGVFVIAYDRLIKSTNIDAYLSFNNVEVGRQQALGIMSALDMDNWDVDANGVARIVELGGSPTDNNAILVRQGQDEILKPYIDAGTVEIVADQWVDNWEAANALKLMENILTATSNDIDGVVASNDGTALGALQAMKAQGLAGVVPISGQDATADGCNSIVKGELTVSILKDTRNLGPLAVNLMDQFIKGSGNIELKSYTLAELTLDDSLEGSVNCVFLEVQQVNKDNVYDLVVVSGFQPYDQVYVDVPEDQLPPKP